MPKVNTPADQRQVMSVTGAFLSQAGIFSRTRIAGARLATLVRQAFRASPTAYGRQYRRLNYPTFRQFFHETDSCRNRRCTTRHTCSQHWSRGSELRRLVLGSNNNERERRFPVPGREFFANANCRGPAPAWDAYSYAASDVLGMQVMSPAAAGSTDDSGVNFSHPSTLESHASGASCLPPLRCRIRHIQDSHGQIPALASRTPFNIFPLCSDAVSLSILSGRVFMINTR